MYGTLYRKYYYCNFYMLIFFIWYSTEIIFNTTLKSIVGVPIKTVSDLVNWLIFAMLMVQIMFFQSYKKRELVMIVVITLPIVCATVLSGSKSILSAWMFIIAARDVDESNFVATAGNVLGEFQRTKVIPEVDAYRYSTVQDLAKENAVIAAVTEANVYKLLIKDISAVQDIVGESTPLVCCMSGTAKGFLNASTEFSKNIEVTEFKRGEITTKVRVVNGVPILSVPSDRMYHQYIFKKGNLENLAESGFEKAEGAEMADWIILPVAAAIAVCKQDKGKIIDPDTNQKADAWFIGYRKYHDVWVKDNQIKTILAHYGKQPAWDEKAASEGGGTK